MDKKTIVYVDGYNLYYGCLKDTPHKWLNIRLLCEHILQPTNAITAIKYFTARVRPRSNDPGLPDRQELYLRALRTDSSCSVHFGVFYSNATRMPLFPTPKNGPRTAQALKVEEKGSDVNLATHLVSDAYEDRMDAAVVITNDSDLVQPIRLVKQRLRKVVGILCPTSRPNRNPSYELSRYATFLKEIEEADLAAAQYNRDLTDAKGNFSCPIEWIRP